MLRKLALVVSFACLVFVAAMIVSCGSSNNHLTTTCTGGPFNVVGDWQGTLTAGGGSSSIIGLINTSGEALFFDSDPGSGPNADPASGSVAALPSITGTCSFSGNVTLYETPAAAVLSGSSIVTGTAQGNVSSASSISVSATINGNSSGFTLNSYTPLTGSVSALSGALLAEDPAQSFQLLLDFTPTTGNNMNFANDPSSNCTTSGTLTQEGSNNVFDFSVTFSGTAEGCPTPQTVTGLAFESSSDIFVVNGNLAGTYLYAVSSTSAVVLEIFRQTAADSELRARPTHSFAAKPSAFIFR